MNTTKLAMAYCKADDMITQLKKEKDKLIALFKDKYREINLCMACEGTKVKVFNYKDGRTASEQKCSLCNGTGEFYDTIDEYFFYKKLNGLAK